MKKLVLILVVVIFIFGFFKVLGWDGVDLLLDNLIRIVWVFLGSYVVLYVFVFWIVMWEYYINDDFVKDEDIKWIWLIRYLGCVFWYIGI